MSKMQVRVSDFAHGLRIFRDVNIIRVKSEDYSLLIMEDYFPMIGSLKGTVDLVTDTDEIHLGRIKGFYLHKNNEFSLLIEEQENES